MHLDANTHHLCSWASTHACPAAALSGLAVKEHHASTSIVTQHALAPVLLWLVPRFSSTCAERGPVQFSQAKADGQIRWAVLNTISVLRRHTDIHRQLAEAMSAGKPVSECISLIEAGLGDSDDI